jgi:hypothetical protein
MKALIIFLLLTTTAYAQEPATPNNFHEHSGVMKGAVPGFAKKPVYFDSRAAEEQLRYLHKKKRVKLIISLDHCEDVDKVINKLNEQNLDIDLLHICRKIRRSGKQYTRNIELFKEIAMYIGNVKFFIHCRYGAHRAVTALTGAWVEKQKLSFKEAFERTGGNKRHFRSKGQKALLNQARKYAKQIEKSK